MKKLLFAMTLLGLLTCCKSKKLAPAATSTDPVTIEQQEPERTMPQGRLKYVSYNHRYSYMPMFSDFELTLNESGEGARLKFNYRFEREVTFDVSDTLLNAARRIIEEERMYAYDRSYKLDLGGRILDGDSWDFSAFFEGKQYVSSSGSNAEPEGNGLKRIGKFFEEAAKQCIDERENQ